MKSLLYSDSALDHAILLDEAGIETGVFGEFRLKSAYAPVFRRRGEALVPIALEAILQPMLKSQPLPHRPFLARLGTADRALVERIGTELHLRNCHQIDAPELDLHLRWTGPWPRLEIGLRAKPSSEEHEPLQIDPCRLIWQFGAEHNLERISLALAGLQPLGCRIGLTGFGSHPEMLRSIEQLRPEIVAVDVDWFQRLSGAPAAVLLFVRMVERLKQSGAQVMVGGIETPAQLHVALKAEADLFQGAHLGPPALAGIPLDPYPRPISELLQARGVVVPLFG